MKRLSDAEYVRMLGTGIFSAALVINQHCWDWRVAATYAVGAGVWIVGYIMNENYYIIR